MKKYYIAILPLLMALVMPAWAADLQAASGTDAAKTATASKAKSHTINLNTADITELEKLNGVGPKTAQAIIDFRNAQGGFTSPDQLLAIKGIGEKTLEKMRDQIVVK
ncbi:MAG: competence protein ComEA [Alcanivorax borkumensis]|jgi:competence protein ComEA|uniref:ComEA-related protein n=1 Tax=Alcanivorax borkumensis (strain ATCC 700651 / DSM 11573 / NCIMB 13689 / SK2) TaxID=393595 RepID=Q0VNR0_ALCBS|nr:MULTISPECIES: helix-hairpin-helix domain-containing protein [Alcanivorax]OJH08464.1 MAG: competence protein ComEA [Alcanivorax borkumensis]BAP14646.1 competence protein ComEA [Alcanivorax sp. NBRC 101098]CAL17188.1 ComEA-related protein [Alcanivorax borkumensis SK2]